MKSTTIKRFLLGAMLSLAAWISTSRNAAADCCVIIPQTNNSIPIYMTVWNSPDTFFTFTINGGPVANGTYGGWCIDAQDSIDPSQGYTVPGTTYTGSLLSTCDPAELALLPTNHIGNPPVGPPPITSLAVWHQLNYLINHRPTNDLWDVQVAINTLIGGPPVYNGDGNPADNPYPTINSNIVQGLISDTLNNAANWHAQCGDKVAVVYNVNNGTNAPDQLVIMEVPCCGVNFTTTPTNVDLGCNPATIPVCQNPVNTNLINAVSCCGRPVTITCSSTDSSFNCKNFRTFTYVATDGFGNNATNSYTVTWTVDTNAPVITAVPTGGNLGCNPATLPTDAGIKAQVTATDTCSQATINVSHLDSGSACAMSRTFSITATDACNNTSAAKTVVYTWKIDTNAPVITFVPAGTNLGCNPISLPSDASIKALVTATDNCGSVTINVSHLDGGTPCAMTRVFSITATDACGNSSTPVTVSYGYKVNTNGPIINCPADYYISNGVTAVTCYTHDDWRGVTCNNPGGVLNNCFSNIYTNNYVLCGVYSDSTRFLACTGPQYVQSLQPCYDRPGSLNDNYLNPTNCGTGNFANHLLCLQLNVDFCDNANLTGFKGSLGDLVLNDPTCALNGQSVRQILNTCHAAIGGCALPPGCTIPQLNDLCSNLNCSFTNNFPSDWACKHITNIVTTNVPPSTSGYATATDSCGGGALAVTYSDVVTPTGCNNSYVIARTWKATDSCGNTSTCTQNIYLGASKASVCGYVFLDGTGYGCLSAGVNAGLSNILVTLKNSSGTIVASNTTDGSGSYCFYNLTAGTYTVSIPASTNYTQTGGCHTNHWLDNTGNDCWYEVDGNQHCKGGDGVDRWKTSDGCQHYKNSSGQDCWKDYYGQSHTQACTYVSCNVPKTNSETFCLAACEAKTCVNFTYCGAAPKCDVTVCGPPKGICGKPCTYTCTLTNSGNACFTNCVVTACGNSYTCPTLKPGQGCSFQFNYCYKTNDYGNFNCQAAASCNYTGSSNPCTTKASCTTAVTYY